MLAAQTIYFLKEYETYVCVCVCERERKSVSVCARACDVCVFVGKGPRYRKKVVRIIF